MRSMVSTGNDGRPLGYCATGCKRVNQTHQLRPRNSSVDEPAVARSLCDKRSVDAKADLFLKRSVAQSKLSALGFADRP